MVIKKRWQLAICLAVAIFSAIRVFGDSKILRTREATQGRSNTQIAKSKRLAIRAVVDQDPDNATLTLKWSLKNVSKEDIRLIESNVLRDYRILIADRYGKPVPLTQEGSGQAMSIPNHSTRRLTYTILGQLHPSTFLRWVCSWLSRFRSRDVAFVQTNGWNKPDLVSTASGILGLDRKCKLRRIDLDDNLA
jgi:hypothetical protein